MATIPEALAVALQYHQSGHLREAELIYRQIVQAQPDHAEAWHCLGAVCLALGQLDEARICNQHVQTARSRHGLNPPTRPEEADRLNDRGIVLAQQGELNQAIACFRQAVAVQPDHALAYNNLGLTLGMQGKWDEAIENCQRALRCKPDFAEAYNTLGDALRHQDRYEEAVAACEQALHLKPDLAQAYNNLGIVLVYQDKLEEAARHFQQAIRFQPHYAKANNNLGNVLYELNRLDDALACYEEALRIDPHSADARYHRSRIWLMRGDFERGWLEFEWRWRTEQTRGFAPPLPQPHWDGSSLNGKTILLWVEQGLGDALQFVRYAPLVKQQGGTVMLLCPDELGRILRTCAGIDHIITVGNPLPPFDFQLPLMSLPAVLKTTLATVPAAVPYLFADAALVEHWKGVVRGAGRVVRGAGGGARGASQSEDQCNAP